ncbi:MAG: hypothetical protein MUP09_02530, partial [Thiovulaceae bacterium]|nr:hypothetical protein [Sulfurimonadaceae bacterium]
MNALNENCIVRVLPRGKTEKDIMLINKNDLLQYLLVEYSINLNETWVKCVNGSALSKAVKSALLTKSIGIKEKGYGDIVNNIERRVPLL